MLICNHLIIYSGLFQLKKMNTETMLKLLPECIPQWIHVACKAKIAMSNAKQKDKDCVKWLERLWNYLRIQCPEDISTLDNLPLLPVYISSNTLVVYPLKEKSALVIIEHDEDSLPKGVQRCLQALGVNLVQDLPKYVANHSIVVGRYVTTPVPHNVLSALEVARKSNQSHGISNVNNKDKSQFREFISRLSEVHLKKHKPLLKGFPLFKTLEGNYVSIKDVSTAAPVNRPNIPINHQLLNLDSHQDEKLALTLGAKMIEPSAFLSSNVFPQLIKQHFPARQVDMVIRYVQQEWGVLKANKAITKFVSKIPFVPNGSGTYRPPNDLLDPENPLLQQMFLGQNIFPTGEYASGDKVVFLQELGLRGPKSVTAEEFLTCINVSETKERAEAMLDFLEAHTDLLRMRIGDRPLLEHLRHIAWVPVLEEKPPLYPVSMTWSCSPFLAKPTDIKSQEWGMLIGSITRVTDTKSHSHLSKLFMWDTPPPLIHIVQHLKQLIVNYSSDEKSRYMEIINTIYKYFTSINANNLQEALEEADLHEWMWWGDGFTAPQNMVQKDTFQGLQPYLYPLPTELRQYIRLFNEFDMVVSCLNEVLVRVLHDIKTYTDNTSHQLEETV